ncbi:MAG: TrkH family potassium uptake protein [Pirellulaceae bacterium]
MNFRLVCKLLGIVSLLIGSMMCLSLPWAFPNWGYRVLQGRELVAGHSFEGEGFMALFLSVVVCGVVGGVLWRLGRNSQEELYRKEAMAVVGLSWVLATVLGALPFTFADVQRGPSIRLDSEHNAPLLYDFDSLLGSHWIAVKPLDPVQFEVISRLVDSPLGARGRSIADLAKESRYHDAGDILKKLASSNRLWEEILVFSDPLEKQENWVHAKWVPMTFTDDLFESQSGFSTTGATVISDLENPRLVPHCILFWRSSTHFLGGLGIIVLFVVLLGQGSAGKALMRAEMPGPNKDGAMARMQQSAWMFAAIYCGLNFILALILIGLELTPFDAFCHAFGTMATGGFSTYNGSVGSFQSSAIDYTITIFMILAGTNFTLLYLCLLRQPGKLLADVEWRTYMGIILVITGLVMGFGIANNDFPADSLAEKVSDAFRYGLFQVVAIVTTTGYGTHDFDAWNNCGRGMLFALMFIGGCAGSTGGGMKVIRHILFVKILRIEIEHSYRPSVVRQLRLGGVPLDDPQLSKNILVYFGVMLILFVGSWLFVIAVEPDITWGHANEHKLIDSATSVAATLNNIGPGLGTVGATQNYGHFSTISKLLFIWLMMLGRIEIFSILVLFLPGFWKDH